MVKVLSWISKQLGYLKNSVPEILKSVALVFMILSGVLVSILLRYFDQNGVLISILGIFVEIIALIIVSYFFRNYLKKGDSETREKS